MFEFQELVKEPRFLWNHQDSPAIQSVLDPFGGHMKSPQSKVTLCHVWIARHLSFSSWTWKRRIHAEFLCDVCAQNSLNSKKNGHKRKVGIWNWQAETITWGSHAETSLYFTHQAQAINCGLLHREKWDEKNIWTTYNMLKAFAQHQQAYLKCWWICQSKKPWEINTDDWCASSFCLVMCDIIFNKCVC